ncbi:MULTISPECIES: hypothetical protein [Streptomyces]|uniref:Uncharacterized protein n=1 Tax=Streptomyces tsukubensis (strain DSM 42081 / NBRC 108919 / NRRL 18488 / 9993) TaxID=1114943 RepID=I2N1E9_STRT9|nr:MULTISPECIES: hypothetical protein [Streptomyces]AZK95009.1 hypothetical protein B7R87_14910 [Streptomyces tsukubensis]EIF90846.1 hypothetical protein [Streptomyces tsukubensis NRRL18488]MYS63144.1 hypothetical protein [Streptomyces sp. SID5473]QKM68925.1 hypothetical protein STSU_018865 [Streptomyces tsukubensis NRRL18488]TAI43731.1 hypothetical protein EWI31_18620 [Streptomyces tsukubensis]
MTKTKRILTAVALAAGASALSVSAAAANGHHSTQAPQGATSLADGVEAINGGIKDLNQLNQLMEVPNHLAPLIGPVAQVAGALQ